MKMVLINIFFLSTILAASSALDCIECFGNGTKCNEQGKSRKCGPGIDLCGRVLFMQNGVQKVAEICASKSYCVGTIDCSKLTTDFGKRYKGATNCVTSCCDEDNCDPPAPLKCYQCQGKGKTCKTNSISCGYKEDRCLRINYKIGEDLMTDERCYQSSRCSNSSEICDLVKKNNQTVKECQTSCCDTENCIAKFKPASSARNCTMCVGNGTKCTGQGQSRKCQPGEGLCSRVWFMQNGVQKVAERCALMDHCTGTIACSKLGSEFGKYFKGATNCITSCCEEDNCDPPAPQKCYQCQGKGKACKTNSISCGYKEDRCLRINYKVGEDLMTDERCYQSSRCSNSSEICDLVKKNTETIKECQMSCCDTENCNAIIKPGNSFGVQIASFLLIASSLILVEILKL
ncbi:uncharacterized protein LOC114531503 isoform X2 [Dendronephthya gigantea]|uniref:uncharacterized protein LOC114531503 isoform X2 n=1 Tax=Dendronephthya gigantea TaxID=151771 RepID=UPI00106C6B90|nr:uncharacterized protein LOC114531503 isoform X2 [Dendronephthya gigantea]